MKAVLMSILLDFMSILEQNGLTEGMAMPQKEKKSIPKFQGKGTKDSQ
jgi:hypothetical protein